MHPSSLDVLKGRATVGEEAPFEINIPSYRDARQVVEVLFRRGEMTPRNRADLEPMLCELERSGQIAESRGNTMSVAQREVIEYMVEPYLDAVKSRAPDSKTAKDWLRYTGEMLRTFGPRMKDRLPDMFFNRFKLGDMDAGFYDSLLALAKIYVNMADLEGALEQSGESLPSTQLVQSIIEALLDAEAPAEEPKPRYVKTTTCHRPLTRSLTEATRHRPLTRSMTKVQRVSHCLRTTQRIR